MDSLSCPSFCNLETLDSNSCDNSLHAGDEKEWEEARCPICIDHPHNAILLSCSAREKGCRPFICDTSYRHSNCFDQFLKSADASCARNQFLEQQSNLTCPFCRGTIKGWDVIQPARQFMNSKTRNCSLETCSFTGNYAELRKHARLKHSSERPSEASEATLTNWDIMEIQRDIDDAFTHHSGIMYDQEGWSDGIWFYGRYLNFPSSSISYIENAISQIAEELQAGQPSPLFSLDDPPPLEDMLHFGIPRTRNRTQRTTQSTNSGSRSNNQALSNSRSSYERVNADLNLVFRSRRYHNGLPVSRPREENDSLIPSRRSSHHREHSPQRSSPRESHRMQHAPTSLRTRHQSPREENNSSISSRRSRSPRRCIQFQTSLRARARSRSRSR